VSLEFTPDGVGDVKLRLTERSGEVHIALHTSDPSITSRLHEGVHELVGSLSTAGYDAEAWTPGHSRQNQSRQQDSRRQRRSAPHPQRFSGAFQSTEEVS
jgi:hypothetical protein